MAVMPVQAAMRGDFVVLLVLVDSDDTADQVAAKVAHHVVGRRLPEPSGPLRVLHGEKVLAAEETVASAGIGPMDFVEVF